MIYRILVDDTDIYFDTLDNTVLSPSINAELNSAGSFEFTLPPNHSYYDSIAAMTSDISVLEDNNLVFYGRATKIDIDWNNQKKVTCEGALAFFNDSVQRPEEFDSILIADFFKKIISAHNTQVADNRKFEVGDITIPEKYVYRKLNYESTFDCLRTMCLDAEGGYFVTRRENDTNYIDWIEDVTETGSQPVEFGLNLLDLTQSLSCTDLATVVIPLGDSIGSSAKVNEATAYLNIYESMSTDSTVVGRVEQGGEVGYSFIMGNTEWYKISIPYSGYALSKYLTIQSGDIALTISHINGGQDYIESDDGIATYGRITKTVSFSSVRDANQLKEKGEKWLTDQQWDRMSIEANAAELHYMDGRPYEAFKCGVLVHVTSMPHIIDKELPITKISLSLDSGVKKVTMGTPAHRDLTEIYASGY